MSLLVVFPFCAKDVDRLLDLLLWCSQLGRNDHPALLVMDADVTWKDAQSAIKLCEQSFNSVSCYSTEQHVEGWIPGSNALFKLAAKIACEWNKSFLLVEPDAVPIKDGWVDAIAIAFASCGKDYMGALVSHQQEGFPSPYMEGVAVYNQDTHLLLEPLIGDTVSWTFSCAKAVVPRAINSPLFQHLWGEKNNPPTFARNNIPGTNIHSLLQIHPETALFHRCKDGSLIRLLRERAGIKVSQPITVVFAFCGKDAHMMAKSMGWIADIQPQLDRTCVLHSDGTVDPRTQSIINTYAQRAFKTVLVSKYPTPKRPYLGWPAACNWAFQHACQFIESRKLGSWLWFESDAVAIKPDYLFQIEQEYERGGKPFMGTRIGDFDGLKMGHINGTSVYPQDALRYIPKAMSNYRYPWDAGMRDEMIQYAHFSNRIMQHCGAVINGKCKPANGAQAKFPTQREVSALIEPGVVFFHPDKSGTLIDRLREIRLV